MVTAKLRVPAGAFRHWSAGDTFGPWQPNAFAVNCSAIGFPGGRSGLESVNAGSALQAADQRPKTDKHTALARFIQIPPRPLRYTCTTRVLLA